MALAGCGQQSGPETFEVTGMITLEGDPVEGALVVFTPKQAGDQLAAQAETDADGKYSLSTYLGGEDYKPGIAAGNYLVTVTKLEVVQDMRRQPKNLLPKKYALPGTTDLSADVVADGKNQFDFNL